MQTATVYGSHGSLTADMATGVIIDRERDGDGYDHIQMLDPTDLRREGGSTDILFVGYFYRTVDGECGYEPALAPVSVFDRQGNIDCFAGNAMRYLPAPVSRA